MPKISIIVPVYKVEDCLQYCINSILNQSYGDFELILVDDGSPDSCGKICEENSKKDNRIKVLHKQNGGLSSARNAGIRIASGDFITFVDSDDLIHPQMLELLYQAIVKNDADLVSTRYKTFQDYNIEFERIDKTTAFVLDRHQFVDNLYPFNFEKIGISAWGKLYKRELFSDISYPEGRIYEDLHIYLKLLNLCQKVVVIEPDLYFYNNDSSSITRSNYLKYDRNDEFLVRLEHVKFFRELKNNAQFEYAVNDYLTFFFRHYFTVYHKFKKQLWPQFKVYYKQHYRMLFTILKNQKVCNARKVCSLLIHFAPRFALSFAKKYIPDCTE